MQPKTNTLALVSAGAAALGYLTFCFCYGGPFPMISIICGIIAITQINKDPLPSYPYMNLEFYGQDTWKVSKKLTVNIGLRGALIKPFHDNLGLMANFNYSKFDPAQAVRFS